MTLKANRVEVIYVIVNQGLYAFRGSPTVIPKQQAHQAVMAVSENPRVPHGTPWATVSALKRIKQN